MKNKNINWFKPAITLLALLALVYISPETPIDPWNLLSLKKIVSMIFALVLVQNLGITLGRYLGVKAGAVLTGFLGGLISSTATTAALAKQSKNANHKRSQVDIITFLSATAAMLFEGIVITYVGAGESHLRLSILFLGPFVGAIALIYYKSKSLKLDQLEIKDHEFQLLPVLKLSLFILSILAVSKLLQNIFGQSGLYLFTFLVSLFEIHGSVIANIQLHESNSIASQLLGNLLFISVLAAMISKLFLIFTLGGPELKKMTVKPTVFLFLSLIASWIVFTFLIYI